MKSRDPFFGGSCVVNNKLSDKNDQLFTIKRVNKNVRVCFVCNRQNDGNRKMTNCSYDTRLTILIEVGIFIPSSARCCVHHFDSFGVLDLHSIYSIEEKKNTTSLTRDEMFKLFTELISKVKSISHFTSYLNLNITDDFCYATTGLIKEQMKDLASVCEVSFRSSNERNIYQLLAVYLFFLKTGASQMVITAYFGLRNRQLVTRYCQQARKMLLKVINILINRLYYELIIIYYYFDFQSFVQNNLGAEHLKRDEWLSKIQIFPKYSSQI
jgi:hypothetical protein